MKTRRYGIAAALLFVTACQPPTQDQSQETAPPRTSPNERFRAFQFASVTEPDGAYVPPPMLTVEVALDRLGFSSGVIDGKATSRDRQALLGFQSANGLAETGEADEPTRTALAKASPAPPTRLVRIPAAFAEGPFQPDLPREAAGQARYDRLSYRDLMEALAERFHTTPQMLVALNSPSTKIGPGAVIRVPDIPDVDPALLGEDARDWNRSLVTLGVSPRQPQAAKVVVDKSDAVLRAYDANGRLIAQFPATMGSAHDPLPIGEWTIQGVSRNPDFHYNPKLFWDVSDAEKAQLLKAGPNSPVGVAWLDLSKEHYGIHGTFEPASIGLTESHGCVRLTNWDAARLAQMVKPGTPAIFQE